METSVLIRHEHEVYAWQLSKIQTQGNGKICKISSKYMHI